MKLLDLLHETGIKCPVDLQDTEIAGVRYDSRDVTKGDLFVCLRGEHTDGHIYAAEAAAQGASCVISEEPLHLTGAACLLTGSARRALAKVARNFYGDSSKDLTMFGVTGTNGKTTTTYMQKAILEACGFSCGIIGTIGYGYGKTKYVSTRTTPESCELQQLFREMREAQVTHCTMEVSSHGLALGRAEGIAFDYAVFTNLTLDHLDFHGDAEEYFRAKTKLFYMAEKASFINEDDPYGARLLWELKNGGRKCYSYSLENEEADLYGRILESSEKGSVVEVYCSSSFKEAFDEECVAESFAREECRDQSDGLDESGKAPDLHRKTRQKLGTLVLKTPGRFNVYNSLAALGSTVAAGADFERAKAALEKLPGVPGRFELVPNDQELTVIVDFAHTPDALESVLKAINAFKRGRLICVFGCGGDRDRTKRPLMGKIAGTLSDFCIVTSDNPRTEEQSEIAAEIEPGVLETGCDYKVIHDRREAIREAISMYENGDVILIAGKGHETYQIIGTEKTHFDDRETALIILNDKN